MIYKYPDYEENPFGFLEGVTNETLTKYYHYNPVVERFKIINNTIAPGIKENMYAISTYGRVFNIRTGRELSLTENNDYYLSTGLQMNDNSRKNYLIHRLVAEAYIPYTEEDIALGRDCINHKDLRPFHNEVSNLERMTRAENNRHARENGADRIKKCMQHSKPKWSDGSVTAGDRNGMVRVTDEQVHKICKSLESGKSRKQACIDAGLEGDYRDLAVVRTIVNGKKEKIYHVCTI